MKTFVRHSEACDGMGRLREGKVSLILSDPPQGVTKAKFDTVPDWDRFWVEAWRILKPGGAVVLMASSMKASILLAQSDPNFRYDLVWVKNKSTGFYNAKRMPLRAHEFILVFYKELGAYTAEKTGGHKPMNAATRASNSVNYGPSALQKSDVGTTLRYATTVLTPPVVNNDSTDRVHPQQKPVELTRRLTRLYSRVGDLVLDPFAGSGSFGQGAVIEGRRFIGFDRDLGFSKTANERVGKTYRENHD